MISYCSFSYIENPIRRSYKEIKIRYIILFPSILFILSFIGLQQYDLRSVKKDSIKRIEANSTLSGKGFEDCFMHFNPGAGFGRSNEVITKFKESKFCIIGDENLQPELAFWGDSHAAAMAPAIEKALLKAKKSALFFSYGACLPISGYYLLNEGYEKECMEFSENFIKKLQEYEIKNMYYIVYWQKKEENLSKEKYGENRLYNFLKENLSTLSHRFNITLVEHVPVYKNQIPMEMRRRILNNEPLSNMVTSKKQHQNQMKHLFNDLNKIIGIRRLAAYEPLCDEEVCYSHDGKLPFYADDWHLNSIGANLLVPLWEKELANP